MFVCYKSALVVFFELAPIGLVDRRVPGPDSGREDDPSV